LLGIECRSKKHHFTDEAFETDPIRDADLGIDGWLVLQVTWAQLQLDPKGVVRRVERALGKRLAEAVPLG
jgi:very-short-patch-repair endonuclease